MQAASAAATPAHEGGKGFAPAHCHPLPAAAQTKTARACTPQGLERPAAQPTRHSERVPVWHSARPRSQNELQTGSVPASGDPVDPPEAHGARAASRAAQAAGPWWPAQSKFPVLAQRA